MSRSCSVLVCVTLLVAPCSARADLPGHSPPDTPPSAVQRGPDGDTAAPNGSGATPAARRGAGTVPEGSPAPPSVSERILSGITRVGPLVVTITREARDLALGNINVFARAARIVPANLGDGVVGYRLFGIRAQSVVGALGLRNGDLLRSVNGRPTTTVGEVLAAYGGLRGASAWTVVVHRGGADVTLLVRVVDGPDTPDGTPDAASSGGATATGNPAGAAGAGAETSTPAVSRRSTRGRSRARE